MGKKEESNRVVAAYDAWEVIDLELQEFIEKMKEDKGAAGAALREWWDLLEEWDRATMEVREALSDANSIEHVAKTFTRKTRAPRRSIPSDRVRSFLEQRGLMGDWLERGVASIKVKVAQACDELEGEDLEAFQQLVEKGKESVTIEGPKPGDYR